MKSVLMSIQPKWCELIASGKKTIEVRKTKPKFETPFKVYIYCTNNNKNRIGSWLHLYCHSSLVSTDILLEDECYRLNGKVIGEFVCDKISDARDVGGDEFYRTSCLSYEDWRQYTDGTKNTIWCWHISDLIIYDKPKELNEFYNECEEPDCDDCPYLRFENNPNSYEGWCEFNEKIPIKRPPQSWCYVEGE